MIKLIRLRDSCGEMQKCFLLFNPIDLDELKKKYPYEPFNFRLVLVNTFDRTYCFTWGCYKNLPQAQNKLMKKCSLAGFETENLFWAYKDDVSVYQIGAVFSDIFIFRRFLTWK